MSGAAALSEQLPIGKVQDGRGFVCLYGYRTFPFLAGGQKYADIAAGLQQGHDDLFSGNIGFQGMCAA